MLNTAGKMGRLVGLSLVLAGLAVARAQEPPVTNVLARAAAAYQRGQQLLADRNWGGALEAYEQATTIRPDFAEAHMQAGFALMQLGFEAGEVNQRFARWQAATERFSRAVELRPHDKTARVYWSEALVQIGDLPLEPATRLACYQGAVEQCRQAVAVAPEDWELYNKWGAILSTKLSPFAGTEATRSGLFREAAGLFSNAVHRAKFSGDLATLHLNWAAALVEAARFEPDCDAKRRLLAQAVEKFERAARSQPNAAPIYTAWGHALVDQWRLSNQRNDLREAIDKFQTSLAMAKDDPAVLYSLAVAYALLDSRLMALQQLQQCFRRDSRQEYRRQAASDRDFDNLRADPTFQALIRGEEAPRLLENPRLRGR